MAVGKTQAQPGIFSRIIQMASPAFVLIAVFVPIGALVYAANFGPLVSLNYVHILTGAMWTGIDLFMGFVLGPSLGKMEPRDRVPVFMRLMPKMAFLMPVLAGVTVTAGLQLVSRMGYSLSSPKIIISLVITGILTIQGLGFLLPNEIQIYRELLSGRPNIEKVSRLGMRNARLGGLQGIFQLALIFVMATIRL